MFAAVQIEKTDDGLAQRIREAIRPTKPEAKNIPVPGGAPFMLIRVMERKQGINIKRIYEIAGNCKDKILYPKDIIVKQIDFTDAGIHKRILINTVISALKKSEIDPVKLNIALVDKKAEFINEAHRLIKHCGFLRVVTDETERYVALAIRIMDTYGASLLINSDTAFALGSDVIISPVYTDEVLEKSSLLFSCERGRCISGIELSLPPKYKKLLPAGIDETQFTCALYELCGVREIADLSYDILSDKGNRISIYSLIKLIKEKIR